jgi:hypothetical protein
VIISRDKSVDKRPKNDAAYAAYVTFKSANEASTAILALEDFEFEERTITASYGMTKYCSYFVRRANCPIPGCLFLHELATADVSLSKVV